MRTTRSPAASGRAPGGCRFRGGPPRPGGRGARRGDSFRKRGVPAPKIEEAISGSAPVESCGTMEKAVARAAELARPGDTVLLSPACASFDQYGNFEERGAHFTELVRRLTGKGNGS